MTYIKNITEIKDLKLNDDCKTLYIRLGVILEDPTSHKIINGDIVLPRHSLSGDNIPSFLSTSDDASYQIIINES